MMKLSYLEVNIKHQTSLQKPRNGYVFPEYSIKHRENFAPTGRIFFLWMALQISRPYREIVNR